MQRNDAVWRFVQAEKPRKEGVVVSACVAGRCDRRSGGPILENESEAFEDGS